MKITQNEISEIFDLYSIYTKKLNIEQLPIITFNETEYFDALGHNLRIKNAQKTIKKNKPLGQCSHKCTIDGNQYNSVIYINTEVMKELKGLHEYTEPITEIKETKKYRYKIVKRKKIGHLEETLIHELLHVKRPELRHGKHFSNLVKSYYQKQ